MTDRRPTILAVTAALCFAAGCGGAEDTPSEEAAKDSPTSTAESGIREVTAGVEGRELSGHSEALSRRARPRSCSTAEWAAASGNS